MNIKITLDFDAYGKSQFDISINNEQVIKDCLNIVNEGLALNIDMDNINYCRSKMQNKVITVYSTFSESDIHTGDILEIL